MLLFSPKDSRRLLPPLAGVLFLRTGESGEMCEWEFSLWGENDL